MKRNMLLVTLLLIAVGTAYLMTHHQKEPPPEPVIVVAPIAPTADTPEVVVKAPEYVLANGSPDGIGKFYMGREIAHVMGHPAIGWLERDEREREEAPSKAIAAFDLRPTDVIADIGAGSGY